MVQVPRWGRAWQRALHSAPCSPAQFTALGRYSDLLIDSKGHRYSVGVVWAPPPKSMPDLQLWCHGGFGTLKLGVDRWPMFCLNEPKTRTPDWLDNWVSAPLLGLTHMLCVVWSDLQSHQFRSLPQGQWIEWKLQNVITILFRMIKAIKQNKRIFITIMV